MALGPIMDKPLSPAGADTSHMSTQLILLFINQLTNTLMC